MVVRDGHGVAIKEEGWDGVIFGFHGGLPDGATGTRTGHYLCAVLSLLRWIHGTAGDVPVTGTEEYLQSEAQQQVEHEIRLTGLAIGCCTSRVVSGFA